ncbi:hypothetical protein [Schleiferilactobacillus perolens]|uniref:Uncharacterized protein n=1 Tax=Schleiferilactobacillus perolens DSM 12744 TaxID=1423792 RepID=A0A0R1MY70_9LACO|nr:hypothetical protein [Schleiferilactobacillus perolens]KRL13071.1 hypothetical protein FD09_GL002612 [Schleiferilactobacillus perolens DSM 12744]
MTKEPNVIKQNNPDGSYFLMNDNGLGYFKRTDRIKAGTITSGSLKTAPRITAMTISKNGVIKVTDDADLPLTRHTPVEGDDFKDAVTKITDAPIGPGEI